MYYCRIIWTFDHMIATSHMVFLNGGFNQTLDSLRAGALTRQ